EFELLLFLRPDCQEVDQHEGEPHPNYHAQALVRRRRLWRPGGGGRLSENDKGTGGHAEKMRRDPGARENGAGRVGGESGLSKGKNASGLGSALFAQQPLDARLEFLPAEPYFSQLPLLVEEPRRGDRADPKALRNLVFPTFSIEMMRPAQARALNRSFHRGF